ncbi:helix-turn-helix transcriptional regulator [Natronorubrum halophilum]|uniref:helix-turn-helix transcriptional regulator n=1 Tax=Natronorubrum halophilum TaxID=1702106 RepID=UPI001EE7836B|nr:hypothetical protein [Natronorubrum halophilum]
MRVSTAVTLALTVLLATSLLGVVAATPTAFAPAPEHAQTNSIADRPLLESASYASSTGSQSPATASSNPAVTQSSLDSVDPKQVIRLDVHENGNTTLTIESRFLLTDAEEEAEFIDYADAVTSGQRDVSYDPRQFDTFRRDAQQATGREMTLENEGWNEGRIVSLEDAGIEGHAASNSTEGTEPRVGIISYSFTWTNFATVDADRIYFGDALTWLPTLADSQRLVIDSPSGFALETPTQLEWTGPYQFSDDELEIVFVRSGTGTSSGPGLSGWLLGGLFVLVVVVGTSSYLLARWKPTVDLPAPLDRLAERVARLEIGGYFGRIGSRLVDRNDQGKRDHRQDSSGAGADGGTAVRSRSETASASNIDSPTAAGTYLEFEENVDDGIDPELLSDEERVLRMLTRNNGRMKQASIVTETGWSNAKVSQLLSQMDDDGDIEKLRIGRENLITLPEVDPTELD